MARRKKRLNQTPSYRLAPRFERILKRQLATQRLRKNAREEKKRALAAIKSYRRHKGDRGSIIFIGSNNRRDPKKGYAIYVTKTGKKWFLKQPTSKPYASVRKRDLELPLRSNLRRAQTVFQRAKLVETGRGKSVLRGSGK